MTDLHTTESAARLLGVSEASIRRWSDAGLLPVQRLGRRGSRRFREIDLLAFQQASPSRTSDEAGTAVTVGAVRLPLHTHIPTFYDSDVGRMRLSLPLLRDSLNGPDMCLLIAAPEVEKAYVEALRGAGIAVAEARARGQLEIIPNIGSSIQTALAGLEDYFWRASKTKSGVPRLVGEMASERKAFRSDRELLEFEYALNALTQRFASITLCQFDVREFDGRVVLGALKAHPDVIGLHLGEVLL
jgi:hypothetical protein